MKINEQSDSHSRRKDTDICFVKKKKRNEDVQNQSITLKKRRDSRFSQNVRTVGTRGVQNSE